MQNMTRMRDSFVIIFFMCCSFVAIPSANAAKKVLYRQCRDGRVYFDPSDDEYLCVRSNKPTMVIKLTSKEKKYFHRGEMAAKPVYAPPPRPYYDEARYFYCTDGQVYYDPAVGAYFCGHSFDPTFRINIGGGGRRHPHRW